MRVVDRNAMVPYSAEQMFALVKDIEGYPEFLPWCTRSELQSRTDDELIASLTIGYGALNSTFSTRNQLQPPVLMSMELLDGPFHQLEGRWEFEPLDESACEINLRVEFEFSSRIQDLLFGGTFETICNELIGAFIKRAHAIYGKSNSD